MEIDLHCKVFQGVHFVLFGFNHVDENRVRSKLVDGGGVDVGQYGPSCTHVIVDKLVYDDPVCVSARNDGKWLVTGLWVDHSFDNGLRVDVTSLLYRPLRELNGIPGAKGLIMCLTGYQRQSRDDVMTMVGLMGAQFSKPLVANKVTHLICYKFEGDKYELASKLRTIKLVNHRWLEDCLRQWMLLPESNYNMSGYDMEMLEAEAKDSEEELNSNPKCFGVRNMKSPNTLRFGLQSTNEISNRLPVLKISNDPTRIVDSMSISTVPINSSKFIHPGKFDKHNVNGSRTCPEAGVFNDAQHSVPSDVNIRTSESEKLKVKNELMSTPLNVSRSPQLCATSYSRRTLWKSPLPLHSGEKLDNADALSKIVEGEMNDNIGLDESSAQMEQVKGVTFSGYEQNPWREHNLVDTGNSNARSPLKRTSDVSKSQKMNEDTKSCAINSACGNEQILGLEMKRFSVDNDDSSECCVKNSQHRASITETSNSIEKPMTSLTCDLPFSKSVFSSTEDGDDGKNIHRTFFQFSEKDMSLDKPDILNYGYGTARVVVGKAEETDRQRQVVLATSESDEGTEANKLSCPTNLNFSMVENIDSHTKQHRIKMFAKKSLGSRPKLGTANQKGSIIMNKPTSNGSISSTHGNDEKCFSSILAISPQTVGIGVQKVMETTDFMANAANFDKCEAMDEDDYSAATENKQADFEQMLDKEKSEVVQLRSDADKLPKDTAPEVQPNKIKVSVLDDVIPSGLIDRVIEPGEPISMRNVELDESRIGDDETSKMNAGDRCSMEKTVSRHSSTKMKSEQGKDGKVSRKKIEVTGKKKPLLLAAGPKTRGHTVPDDRSEKENGSISSTHGNNEKCFSSILAISPQTVSIGVQKAMETTDLVANTANFHKCEAMDEDDKTEATENKQLDFEQMLDKKKSEVVQFRSDADKLPKDTASEVQPNELKTSVLDVVIPSGLIERVIEPGELVSMRNVELDESRIGDDETSRMNAGDRCPMEKTISKNSSTKMKSEQGKDGKASRKEIEVTCKKKPLLLAAGPKTKGHTVPDDKSEKENEPFMIGDQTSDKHCLVKPTVKSNAKQRKTTKKSEEISVDSSMVFKEILREVKSEPLCFILSGHRLQRKEFQQVIRHLKGRLCRDSHQWSYQATHFITPDPIRRTEKFFAAAASGRWILKPEYLTHCSQAGRFLKEESYEWYKNGLTEDGAINLEAPRKWRLMRERTGHGALYGMRIIIYGECIAPPLDTLKRAVKSGDGTILATSPPYTRFLNSGVDFAVVSPGMPRADLWVQEFLNNEIPCVAADYLVEYVCKPGYPLEKHVLYNTQPWAEKSFTNLKRRADEVAEDISPPDDCSDDIDIACQECGSRDRGEVMLICGNEDGSNGCGVGMHIDCCNPPLLDIPDGDWFCPECISSRNIKNSPNKRKKGVSVRRK